jgi:hypothetical protein
MRVVSGPSRTRGGPALHQERVMALPALQLKPFRVSPFLDMDILMRAEAV